MNKGDFLYLLTEKIELEKRIKNEKYVLYKKNDTKQKIPKTTYKKIQTDKFDWLLVKDFLGKEIAEIFNLSYFGHAMTEEVAFSQINKLENFISNN